MNSILNTIEPSEYHRRKRQVWIAGRIGRTKLQTLQLWIRMKHWNANRRGTIACRVSKIDRRFESGNQSLIAVGCWRRERNDGWGVLQQSADLIKPHLREPAVTVTGEQRLVAFPQRLVTVHSRSIVAEEWLGHECRCLAILVSSIANYIFEYLQVVGRAQQRRIPKIDFTLTRRCYFMVMTFNGDATLRQDQRDFGTKIAQRVGGRNREVAFLATDVITELSAA